MDETQRTNSWLAEMMYEIWEDNFSDIPRKNFVLIKFGRSSKRQLGSIKWSSPRTKIRSLMKKRAIREQYEAQDDKRVTVITITKKFLNTEIPEYVVKATIAHELCHYTHGFSSPLKQTYRHPHQGGIIRKELESRGLGELRKKAKRWLKENWQDYALS
ncbi:hypothetical protein JW710_04040 [Candidatus Dojkabacteria bacterium]|nr:hypothetical protein [Candidatus Dojkabacteria bacterium]